jgi:hypothetical protein
LSTWGGFFLTSNAGEKLAGKVLDLAVGKWYEVVTLKEVEYTLAEKIHDDADVSSVIEAVSEVNAAVPVLGVVGSECLQDPEFDLTRLAVLLHGADDLDGDKLVGCLLPRLHDLAERSLAKELDHLV